MKRYKKANEGIRAPEEVKEKAARPNQKRPYSRWMGAVAAVLAVAIIGGAALWPGRAGGPTAENDPAPLSEGIAPRSVPEDGDALLAGNENAPVAYASGSHYAHALSLAAYPEMAPYPRDEDYFSDVGDGEDNWQKASNAYSKAYSAWWESRQALRPDADYTGMLDEFLSRSTTQFLTGAGEENRVYSPLNVYMALSMLAETTGGSSRRQILDLLQADSIESLRAQAAALWRDNYRDDGVVTTILANSLWLRDDMTYSQKTLDTLAEDYYASSFSGTMGDEAYDQALRDWINEQTRGLLAEQADGLEMVPETVLALASTIYFKAAWSGEFDKERTETDTFHAPSGDMDTDFMRRTTMGTYYWGEHFSAVSLSFQESGSMWLILPDEGYTVDELLASGEAMEFLLASKSGYLDEETGKFGFYYYEDPDMDESQAVWVDVWPDQKQLNINLSMPKFDVSSDLDLIEGLQALGVTDVFDMGASNFDPLEASTDDPLYVSAAQHAARVKVDEEGCEAAAYTIMMMLTGGFILPDGEVDFILDRPFLFAITGGWTGLPLFTGVVNQPNG